jgi:hypothetical protein
VVVELAIFRVEKKLTIRKEPLSFVRLGEKDEHL